MLYVDVDDVCSAFEVYAKKILNNEISKGGGSLTHIVNLCYPEPITILELANIVKELITKHSKGKIVPKVKIVETGQPSPFTAEDKELQYSRM